MSFPVITYIPQVDPSVVGASPAPEHTASLFGRAQSSSFHPTVPSVGAHFGVGAGAALHPAAAFPADAYGISDRPKKVCTLFYGLSVCKPLTLNYRVMIHLYYLSGFS